MSEFINNQSVEKQEQLKTLIKRLHDGEDPEVIKELFKEQFAEISTSEISEMEQALISEGLPVEEVQRLCDVHASVFGGSISDIHAGGVKETPGHPLHVLSEENTRIEKLIDEEITPYLEQSGNMPLLMLRVGIDRLAEINKHYARKEQLFFPFLEKKGITGPPQVMWGVDDEIREDLRQVKKMLDAKDTTVAQVKEPILALLKKVKDMVFKEENILIPLLSEKLNLYNFIKIDEGSDEVGYFIEKPKQLWNKEAHPELAAELEAPKDGTVPFDAGSLTFEEVNAMLNVLPFDMTFVDKDGYVKYFTQGKERIFDRPITILGRHVNMCHPPASVHVVEKIVENFRSGKKDNEDFWIKFRGAFVHIRYFAVRGKDGEFLGTLEVTQDIQPIRDLEGEKRLMDEDA
ncbi:DUF438 domain-containing protein [Liberiplasma polymorphum]|uniref:DUF438 domain-containing protein n=1 Tax=Liberiplasma polymorphum TaxID=3374570 RepID=UPI00377345F8